jgi:hypothetical protein
MFRSSTNSISGWIELEEHRKAHRFDVDWRVIVKGRDEVGATLEEPGFLVNLSSRGAFLHLRKRLTIGKKLEVWIEVPFKNERWMAYSAEVVRCEEVFPKVGIGVRFTKLRPKPTAVQ